VGVVGGAGYAGGELCRLLLGHPAVETVLPTSRGDEPFARVHPNLAASGLQFVPVEAVEEAAADLDAVFLATPAGEAMRRAPALLDAGVRVIDLSADFRFRDPGVYARVYGRDHTAPELLDAAACGITELYRDQVRGARLVANPGCYVITAVLGLAPLLRDGLVAPDAELHVHAVNGTTGAGTTPRTELQHAEAGTTMLAYSLEGHRHGPEMEARLHELSGDEHRVVLSTAHGPFARGIHVQAHVPLAVDADRDTLLERYVDAYGDGHDREHFVVVSGLPKRGGLNAKDYAAYPRVADVAGANFCHVGVDVDRDRGVAKVVAVSDNLVKGAAGSAIQNLNAALGLPETAGLEQYAL